MTSDETGIDTVITTTGQPSGTTHSSGAAVPVVYTKGPGGASCVFVLDIADTSSMLPPGSSGAYFNLYCPNNKIYRGIYVSGGGRFGTPVAVLSPVPLAPARVTPAVLAQRAENLLPLPTPTANHNPTDALTGLSTWWWISPAQWRTLRQRTAVGAVWVVVTAKPTSSTWDAGDGSPALTCSGPGTPYDPNEPASSQQSYCTHTYTRSSASQPQRGPNPNDRYFTVTVTVTWQVSWVGSGGLAGTLPAITRSYHFPLQVFERETVVSSSSG
ncbi:MAG: hypothetical protein ACYCO3_07680 [Mycobacteriales bacterium]